MNSTDRILTLWRPLYCCHTGTAIKHPVSADLVKSSFVFDAQRWASECPDVKNYKWQLNSVLHCMLYSCTRYGNSGRQRVKCHADFSIFSSLSSAAFCVRSRARAELSRNWYTTAPTSRDTLRSSWVLYIQTDRHRSRDRNNTGHVTVTGR